MPNRVKPEVDFDPRPILKKLEQGQKRLDPIEKRLDNLETRKAKGVLDWITSQKVLGIIAIAGVATGLTGVFLSPLYARHLQHSDDDAKVQVGNLVNEKLAPIDSRLRSIEGDVALMRGKLDALMPLMNDLIQHQLASAVALPRQDFVKQLTRVSLALSAAKAQSVIIPAPIVQGLQERVEATSPEQPGYWSAATTLVSYKSPPAHPNLPNCVFTPPGFSPFLLSTQGNTRTLSIAFSNCTLVLDAPEIFEFSRAGDALAKLRSTPANKSVVPFYQLQNVHIVYRGGPTIPPGLIICLECTYDIRSSGKPPSQVRALTEKLLAAGDYKKITVEALPSPAAG
jgi:hypothetical protein